MCTGVMQVDYGVLAACFEVHGQDYSCSIVQLFEPMDSFGTPLSNDYDCPLLSLSSLFRCVFSTFIMQSVSIMHECTPTCVVKQVNSAMQVERHSIISPKYVFVHDFCNCLYSYIACTLVTEFHDFLNSRYMMKTWQG